MKILIKFQENFESTNKVFDENNKNRTLALMKNVFQLIDVFGPLFINSILFLDFNSFSGNLSFKTYWKFISKI